MRRAFVPVSLAMAAILVFFCACALAQTQPKGSFPQRASTPQSEERQQNQEERAARVQERIELVIARFENNKERHVAAYNAVRAQVQQIVTSLAAAGYDVSKLSADLKTLDSMILKFAQDYVSFIDLLRATEAYTPYESDGQFQAALEAARAQLQVVRQDSLDIRYFYQTTIRPDVAALASQTPSSTAPTSTGP